MRAKMARPTKDVEIRDRIIAAAESTFAVVGLEKATLRDITARAGVNVAAVSYYFGSKSDLVLSVFDRLSTRLNDQRIRDLDACLDAARAAGSVPSLRAILAAFIKPYLGGKSGRLFARLILQHRIAPSDVTKAVIASHFDPMAKRFIQAIAEACPDVDLKVIYWRYVFMIGSVVYTVADLGVLDRTARLSGGTVRAKKPADLQDALLDYLIAGIRGLPTPDPAAVATPRRSRAAVQH